VSLCLCNDSAIASLPLCSGYAIASRVALQSLIALQSIRESLCICSVIALQSLCNRTQIALRLRRFRFRFVIGLLSRCESLCNRSAITLQLLSNGSAIASLSLCDDFEIKPRIALQSLCNCVDSDLNMSRYRVASHS
jgi:hypothetical protein